MFAVTNADTGAPASFSQWTEEQKNEFFRQNIGEDTGGDSPEQLVAANIPEGNEGEALA